jgi:hypothetical protein
MKRGCEREKRGKPPREKVTKNAPRSLLKKFALGLSKPAEKAEL